jgi:hypothetical protein
LRSMLGTPPLATCFYGNAKIVVESYDMMNLLIDKIHTLENHKITCEPVDLTACTASAAATLLRSISRLTGKHHPSLQDAVFGVRKRLATGTHRKLAEFCSYNTFIRHFPEASIDDLIQTAFEERGIRDCDLEKQLDSKHMEGTTSSHSNY